VQTIREGRELTVMGSSWDDVLAVDESALRTLFAQVDTERLRLVQRNVPATEGIDVLVAGDRLSLWLGPHRLAVLRVDR
jgi:hypothetical protein